jgi:hypothetical protein
MLAIAGGILIALLSLIFLRELLAIGVVIIGAIGVIIAAFIAFYLLRNYPESLILFGGLAALVILYIALNAFAKNPKYAGAWLRPAWTEDQKVSKARRLKSIISEQELELSKARERAVNELNNRKHELLRELISTSEAFIDKHNIPCRAFLDHDHLYIIWAKDEARVKNYITSVSVDLSGKKELPAKDSHVRFYFLGAERGSGKTVVGLDRCRRALRRVLTSLA